MKTLHTTKNCNYRKFLHKQLKHGKISGQFYRFLCKNFPYRLTCRAIDMNVRKVMGGKINESTAINILKEKEKDEMKRQAEMYKSNIECRNKISEKKTAKKFTTAEDVGRDISGRRTTPYTKPLLSIESVYDKDIAKISNRAKQKYLELIEEKFNANKISRKVYNHAVLFVKKCMRENLYLPTRFKSSFYKVYDNDGYNIHSREVEFFAYFKLAFSKTHKYSIYKQQIR